MYTKGMFSTKTVCVSQCDREESEAVKQGNGELQDSVENKRSLSVDDFSTICRTCLNKDGLTPIFDGVLEKSGDRLSLVHLLKQCIYIQVKPSDNLPQNICHVCVTRLKKIYGFQRLCLLNDSLLKTIVTQTSSQWNCDQTASFNLATCDREGSEIDDDLGCNDSPNYSYTEGYCDLDPDFTQKFCESTERTVSVEHGKNVLKEAHCLDCLPKSDNEYASPKDACALQDGIDVVSLQINENKSEPHIQLAPCVYDNSAAAEGENEKIILNDMPKGQITIQTPEKELDTDKMEKEVQLISKSDKKIKEFKCTKCVLTFKTRDDYLIHRRVAKHTKNPLSNCEVCNKLFLRCKLKLHMRTHTKEKPYECHICLWKFNQKGNLERHVKKHNREKPHVCQVCGRGFIHSDSLDNHKKIHEHKNTTQLPPEPVSRPASYNFTCEYCGRFFKRKDPYNQHVQRHHADRLAQDVSESNDCQGEKRHTCDTCQKSFKDKQGLKIHKLTHGEKQELCNVCGKSFFTQSSLKTHLRIHTGERPYTCTICQKSFTNKTTLDSHMNTHMGVRPYGCEVCSKRFTQYQHLTAHLRTHTGERPYSCSYCGRSFALKNTMRVHQRTHTGETPYTCEVCGKGFKDRSTRNKHRKHNHG